jgi:hypothetical protein
MDKIGRNDPCSCGSGKKYKKCCLGPNSGDKNGSTTVATPSLRQISDDASPLEIDFTYNPDIDIPEAERHSIEDVACWRKAPAADSGKRSMINVFEKPFALGDIVLSASQIKGNQYIENGARRKPQMVCYYGRGHPLGTCDVDSHGVCRLVRSPDVPRGALILKSARFDYETAKLMYDDGLPVVVPFGYGKIRGLEFCPAETHISRPDVMLSLPPHMQMFNVMSMLTDPEFFSKALEKHEVGITLHGLRSDKDRRLYGFFAERSKSLDADGKANLLDDLFLTYGKAMRWYHGRGWILAYPHPDNWAVSEMTEGRKLKNLPNALSVFPKHELVAHDVAGDFPCTYKNRRVDMAAEQFFGKVLWNISNATEALLYFYDDARTMEQMSRIGDERISDMYKFIKPMWDVSRSTGFNPSRSFFKGYLGDEYRKVDMQIFERPSEINITMFMAEAAQRRQPLYRAATRGIPAAIKSLYL